MDKLRVVLAHMPRLVREILRSELERDQDVEVVEDVADLALLADAVRRRSIDVVFIERAPNESVVDVFRILDPNLHVRVLAIAGGAREAVLYELSFHATPVAEVTPGALVEAVRAAAQAQRL